MVQSLPAVLCHQAEQGQEGPAEGVEAGVAIVGVATRLQALEAIRTLPVNIPSQMISSGAGGPLRTTRLVSIFLWFLISLTT